MRRAEQQGKHGKRGPAMGLPPQQVQQGQKNAQTHKQTQSSQPVAETAQQRPAQHIASAYQGDQPLA